MSQRQDCKHTVLAGIFGEGTFGDIHINQLFFDWLGSEAAVTSRNLMDRQRQFLVAKGITVKHINDGWFEWLGLEGFTGSLSDRWQAYWCSHTGDPSGAIPDGTSMRLLPLLTDRYDARPEYRAYAGLHATLYRNSAATVIDYLGNVIEVYPNEFRFQGARRVDHADGVDYGAGALGVQYFDTDPGGTPLPEPAGLMVEEESTNLFLNDNGTQGITTTAQDYTISVTGTGDITVSGTATGTATAGSPLTVTATAGTLTCTVSGDIGIGQVEAKSYATSAIPTSGAAATRLEDNCQTSWPSGLVNDFVLGCDCHYNATAGNNALLDAGGGTSRLLLAHSSLVRYQPNKNVPAGANVVNIDGRVDDTDYSYQHRVSSTQGFDVFADGIKGTNAPNTDDFPVEFTELNIGKRVTNDRQWNGNIKNINLRSGDIADGDI